MGSKEFPSNLKEQAKLEEDSTKLSEEENQFEELKKIFGVDTFPGHRKAREIFLKFAQQTLQKEGGREWLLREKSSLLAELAETEKDSDETLDRIAEEARFNGFICLRDLASILAAEAGCNEVLPKLWEVFRCNFNGRKIRTDTPNGLKFGWYRLLRRVAGIGSIPPEGCSNRYWVDPVLGSLPPMQNYLNLYGRDPATGDLKVKPIKDRGDGDFVKLDDLQEYLKNTGRAFKLNFPLPKRLFPPALQASQSFPPSLPERLLRPTSQPEGSLPLEMKPLNVWKKVDSSHWQIAFNGESWGTFDHMDGFEYLRFYLKNSPNEYTGVDIDREVNTDKKNPVDMERFKVDFQRDKEGNLKVVGLRDGSMKKTISRDMKMDLHDPKDRMWFEKIKRECDWIKAQEDNVSEAINQDNFREQREALEDYICEIKEHPVSEDEISKINDAVRKAIERAVNELKWRGAEKLVKHLEESFSPRYKEKSALLGTRSKGYKPNPPIEWDLG